LRFIKKALFSERNIFGRKDGKNGIFDRRNMKDLKTPRRLAVAAARRAAVLLAPRKRFARRTEEREAER